MFYGMREVIVRDLNGFWITFGQEIPAEVLTPWPAMDSALLQPYEGKYKSDGGSAVLITSQGRAAARVSGRCARVFLKSKCLFRRQRRADDVADVRAGRQGNAIFRVR